VGPREEDGEEREEGNTMGRRKRKRGVGG